MLHTRIQSRQPSPGLKVLALFAAVLAVLAGCRTFDDLSPRSRKQAEASARLLQQQAQNMRFADHYVSSLIEAVHRREFAIEDAAQRYALSGWLLAQANTAYISASGDNSVIGCLDLVALATLSRMTVEHIGPQRFPTEAGPLLAVHRTLEAEAWKLSDGVLSPAQQNDLRTLLEQWHDQNPGADMGPFMRFQEFVRLAPTQRTSTGKSLPSSLIGLVGLDPMAGLDPAVRQVEQTRLLAERAIYYAQRMPILMDLQLDRSLNRMAAGPESRRLQQQTASMTSSAERFAAVAEALPADVAREREAFMRQLAELLDAQAETLTPMLLELRAALEAGNTTAASVDQAVRSIDALVARAKAPPPPGQSPGRPFDVTEYTQAAAEISRAANELNQLLGALGTRAPELGTAVGASVEQGRTLVDYLFVRAAWLVALLLGGLLAVLLLYRWLAPRIRPA
jgi:uncharacterized protein YukE